MILSRALRRQFTWHRRFSLEADGAIAAPCRSGSAWQFGDEEHGPAKDTTAPLKPSLRYHRTRWMTSLPVECFRFGTQFLTAVSGAAPEDALRQGQRTTNSSLSPNYLSTRRCRFPSSRATPSLLVPSRTSGEVTGPRHRREPGRARNSLR